jgi:hypothetical protein
MSQVGSGRGKPQSLHGKLGLGDRHTGSAAPAQIEPLIDGDRGFGPPQAGKVSGPGEILNLDAQLWIGAIASLPNASLGSIHCRPRGNDRGGTGFSLL